MVIVVMSTPVVFLLTIILYLDIWFTTHFHSEKVLLGLKGSSVVLSPGDVVTSITSITWKHGADLAAEWSGGNPTFYRIFKDGSSLNTKTGELTINDVRPEHSGKYTPDINGKILSALKLQVLSPVPKPRITPDCNPEKTKCTLTCSFDRTDDLGDVEVFWILDDRHENRTELQITKDTKEETFICSLKNPVSSENSTELKNPLFSEKVLLGLKGSSVVLSPGEAETSITSITWKHGADLGAEWFGGDTTFYRIFNDGCSLNTETGELTINDVRPEHGGEYTPEINGKILSAQKLRVFSPVPKPRITHDCNPEKTKCTLTCSFDRTDDLGDVEVFWILDDRRENGTELQITKETKEETFICSLKNPVSSENSTELKNPLFSGGTSLSFLLFLLVIPLIGVGLFLIFHFKIHKIFRGRNEQRSSAAEEQKEVRQNNGSPTNIPLTDSPAGGDAARPEESTSLLETEECNETSNVTVTVEISPQTESNTSNTQEPAENPNPAPSSDSNPDPDPETNKEAEDQNTDPPGEDNHQTDSGSAENDLPEAERPEDSSGSADGTVSTSEPS